MAAPGLCALTDALAHNHLLVGTLTAYLQRHLDADLHHHPLPADHQRGRPHPP
ncbi:hypothetical protein ACF1BE_31155 [Streptomyces sp. NPDC014991]|uniref:hypothetical protein n=1 Tax=Streptomyces sp. NPDC014991 TaxID=3364935 RepID=UPI0036F8E412